MDMLLARPCEGRITSGYGRRKHPVTGLMTGHNGIDIGAINSQRDVANIPIRAVADGIVVRRSPNGQFGTYGSALILRHRINGKQYETLYAHLKSFNVNNGQSVRRGQQIGLMGATGRVTGRHLHFEVHSPSWNGQYSGELNPLRYMALVPYLGSNGNDVLEVQKLLVKHGHTLVADGSFGPATNTALRAFQGSHKLTVDGLAGPATMNALRNNKIKEDGALTMNQYNELKNKIEDLEKLVKKSPRNVSESFKNQWKWASDKKFLDGSNPQNPVTREQLSAILHRYSETNNLSVTSRDDLIELMKNLYTDEIFLTDHSKNVSNLSETAIINLLISAFNRVYRENRDE